MITLALVLIDLASLATLAVAAYFTRSGIRRFTGALAGGAAVGLSSPLITSIASARQWWRCPFLDLPYAPLLTFLGLAISFAMIALVGWRIERRFGWRGVAWSLAVVCVIGPPRDYAIAAMYPKLMVFGPGFAPIAGNSLVYGCTVALALLVMRLIAGPAAEDRLARSSLATV